MVRPKRAARSRGSRRLISVSQLLWASALVAVVCLVVVVAVTWPRPLPSMLRTKSETTAAGAPTSPSPERPIFATRPPGEALPSDDECAGLVTPAKETVPGNVTYNKRAGSQRLAESFFDSGSHDERATTEIAARVTGAYSGSTREILQWTACKWGIDEGIVRAQAQAESSWRQSMKSDWTTNGDYCAPGHGLGEDGRQGQCPESWGILQVRYRFFSTAFPDAMQSTAFNADTAYAVWRACYEGYEWWLSNQSDPGHSYQAGDAWGCIGRWYSGRWYDDLAKEYIDCVQRITEGRPPCR
jgi:hypothetical protein